MSFICSGCGKNSEVEVFIQKDMWKVFNYATGSDNLLCKDCIIKLTEYIFGIKELDDSFDYSSKRY